MLAPVGDRITTSVSDLVLAKFKDYHCLLTGSATQALSLALMICKRNQESDRNEVIIPAYACPDLVSACIAADLVPVICDIGADDPGYDLDSVKKAIGPATLALVAVNFLGIRDRILELSEVCEAQHVTLVQDNAQWFPTTRESLTGESDYVCFSFGRGKPVSLLGGGLLLLKPGIYSTHAEFIKDICKTQYAGSISWLKSLTRIHAYNILRHPFPYGFLHAVPGFKTGQTIYKKPVPIRAIGTLEESILGANISNYSNRSRETETFFRTNISGKAGAIINLPVVLQSRTGTLLRYPVLLESKRERDRCLDYFNSAGLGASAMYKKPMWDIQDIPDCLQTNGKYTGACSIADRLLTLPLHDGIKARHLEKFSDSFNELGWR